MNSNTEDRPFSRRDNKNRASVGRNQQLLWLSIALALALASTASAQSYRVLKSFTSTAGSGNYPDGAHPYGGLLVLEGTLYGMATWGGQPGNGTVFKLNTDGSGFTVLKNFDDAGGSCPCQGLIGSNGTLYGVTRWGGSGGLGVVFKLNTDGSAFTVLKNFTGSDGEQPYCTLALDGSTLYGTAMSGGTSSNGVVFKMNTDGSGYAVLKHFRGNDGQRPMGNLALSGTGLYGTTDWGGANGCGVVFKINTDGSGYVILKNLDLSAAYPLGGVVLSGATLYAASSFPGALFKLNTDGSGYGVLRGLSSGDGTGLYGGVVVAGNTLYGATASGGDASNDGVVFQLNVDGSGFAVLKNFSASDGRNAWGSVAFVNGVLYGTTLYGGASDLGVVFALSLPPSILTSPQTQTAYRESTVDLTAQATGIAPLYYLWFANGTNLISCGTNSYLELTNLQPSQVGVYTVVVTNIYGAVTSSPAILNVIPPVGQRAVPAISLTGETGSSLNIEYTGSLGSPSSWLALDTVNLTNPPQYYFDISAPLPPQRFYRVWQTGTPAVPPSLNLSSMVTAITLTGNIGDSLRVDYINRIGPTNAWVTLATVTLTNTTQLYFDTSAWRQPQRLYRFVQVP
jgi:uncharacterized repeat protein (TIGR03803 family)